MALPSTPSVAVVFITVFILLVVLIPLTEGKPHKPKHSGSSHLIRKSSQLKLFLWKQPDPRRKNRFPPYLIAHFPSSSARATAAVGGGGNSSSPSFTPTSNATHSPTTPAPPPTSVLLSMVMIIPGGSYMVVNDQTEGTYAAGWFVELGIAAFVLVYRVPHTHGTNAPLEDALQAMRVLRSSAKQWSLDPSKLGVIGFSSGGHIAAMVCTHYKDPLPALPPHLGKGVAPKEIPPLFRNISARPDFAILAYPVITVISEGTRHNGSVNFLLGSERVRRDPTLTRFYSAELNVHSKIPPTLIVHSANDFLVSSNNSRLYYDACKASNVPVELHLLPGRSHGYAMGGVKPWPGINNTEEESSWYRHLLPQWLRSQRLLS